MGDMEAGNDEPEKKGVGVIGGAAALGAGALAGTGAGTALYKKAGQGVNEAIEKAGNAADKAGRETLSTYRSAHPRPRFDAAPAEREAWSTARRAEVEKAVAPHMENVKKLEGNLTNLETAEKSNFLKKGTVVFKEGSMKVKGTVLAAAVSAALLTGYIIKKIRNSGSHAERIEQERAAAPSTGPAVS